MNSAKTEINIWIFLLLIGFLGLIIGLIINTFTDTSKSNNYKDNNETDNYNHIDFD